MTNTQTNTQTNARANSQATGVELVLMPMRARHLSEVVRIEEAVQPTPWPRSIFESELAHNRGDRRYTIAVADRTLAGFCGVWRVVDETHITTIAVAPNWQRHRVAQRLMVDAGRWALAEGATSMTLEVRASNTAAQALYRKFGFAPVGLRRGYYGGAEDALIMTAEDLTTPEWQSRLERLAAEVEQAEVETGAVEQ